ncbi:hypothetical protein ACIP6X_00165 [Streptomyces coeruleorubidus]|jgi:cell wall assembly regulator SMI1|uniref:hypothetical protein n=1 Tax=Streptomyces coeruleorubidus TaxID=116188 RepID=UPI0038025D39
MEPAPLGESWQRVERWLQERGRARELAPPATPSDIARTEKQLGTGLHPDHALLLLGHNGRPHERIHEHDKLGASHLSSHLMWSSLPAAPTAARPHP